MKIRIFNAPEIDYENLEKTVNDFLEDKRFVLSVNSHIDSAISRIFIIVAYTEKQEKGK